MNSPKLSYPFSAFYAALTRGAFYSEVLVPIVASPLFICLVSSCTESHQVA
jgi:ABC-type transport system involved in cytochrome c biogenesis permease component